MDFKLTVNDKYLLAGLSAARIASNADLPKDKDGNPINPVLDDQTYLTARVNEVLASYAKQFGYDVQEVATKVADATAAQDKIDSV